MKIPSAFLVAVLSLFFSFQTTAQNNGSSRSFKLNVELPVPWVDFHPSAPHNKEARQKNSSANTYHRNGHWGGFYFHYSNLADNARQINQFGDIELNAPKSYGWSLNFMQISASLTPDSEVLFVTGLGYDWNKYRFRNGVTIQNIGGVTRVVQPYSQNEVRSSIIKTQYLTVPLLLDWQFGAHRGRRAFISAGIVANINTRSLSRIHFASDGGLRTDLDDINVKLLRPDIMAIAGIGRFRLTASYAPQSMFEKNHGPDMRPVSIGIRIF